MVTEPLVFEVEAHEHIVGGQHTIIQGVPDRETAHKVTDERRAMFEQMVQSQIKVARNAC